MSILYDTHMHTSFSPDSTAELSDQVEKARSIGLNGICITDHMDYDFPVDQCPGHDTNPFIFDVKKYFDSRKIISKNMSDFEVLTGIEIGLQTDPVVIEKNKKLISENSFDEVIGSIHLIDKKDPYYPTFWEEQNNKSIIKKYFEITLDNLKAFSDINILGHLDYATRYMPNINDYDPKEYLEITDAIMIFLIKHDIALEINTSGLKKGYGLTNPHPELIKRYYELGGRLITVGSDAHAQDAIAYGFDTIRDELISYGFKEYAVFKSRSPILNPL